MDNENSATLREYEDMFGFGLRKSNAPSNNKLVTIPEKYVNILEHEGEFELVDAITEFAALAPSRKPAANVSQIKTAFNEMAGIDHKVVDQLQGMLHPDLLRLAKQLFIPTKLADLDDMTLRENRLRNAFLQFNDAEKPPSDRQASTVLSYVGGILYAGNKAICDAGPFVVMEYVFKSFPKQAWRIYSQIKEDLGKEEQKYWTSSGYKNMLEYYRSYRSISRSMNKFTKISQLDRLDQDHPYNWFDLEYDEDDAPYIVGNMPPSVFERFPQSTIIDKETLIRNKRNYRDDLILANVIKGDQDGAKSNDIELLDALWEASKAGATVFVHVALEKHHVRGRVFCKPRPHNLAMILQLGESFDSLSDIYDSMGEQIRAANIKRNVSYFDDYGEYRKSKYRWHSCLTTMLKVYIDWLPDIKQFWVGEATQVKFKDVKTRPPTRLLRRDDMAKKMLSQRSCKFDGSFYQIKPVKLRPGPIYSQLPRIGPVPVAINSLVKYAKQQGMTTRYVCGQWILE